MSFRTFRRRARRVAAAALPLPFALLAACQTEGGRIVEPLPDGQRGIVSYGPSQRLGDGIVRSYVIAERDGGAPAEIGVALSERALEGLPTAGDGHAGGGHAMPNRIDLELPARQGTPFRYVELNWNPEGHEPDGVYAGHPHFDFHFHVVPKSVREQIVPTNPDYEAKLNNLPAAEFVPPFVTVLAPPGLPPSSIVVPEMGIHWNDVRSPELQNLLGKPEAYRDFTTTFIHGSWDGQFIFWEPMITRAYILAKKAATDAAVRDEIIPLPVPSRYQAPGYYPTAYRITWNADRREYRVALTGLTRRD